MKIYLAHPRLIKEKGLQIQKCLEDEGIEVINPFTTVEQGQPMSAIVERERKIILEEVDAVVAIVDDVWTIGTTMEAGISWDHSIPVYVLWFSKQSEKSWYSYIATKIVYDLSSLLEILKR